MIRSPRPAARKLKVFRVQPQAYQGFCAATSPLDNRSDRIRRELLDACSRPPEKFPQRAVKADLTAFSVLLGEQEVQALEEASQGAGVSKNVFVEAVLARAVSQHAGR